MQKNSSDHPYTIKINDATLLRIEGQDAASFLQGQISCDIKQINEQQSSLSCCCDRKGRVLFSFRIFFKAGIYYLYLPKQIAESALAHLRKYLIIAKVKLSLEDCFIRGLGGANIQSRLAEQFNELPKNFGECVHQHHSTLICVDDKTPRYLLINSTPDQYSDLEQKDLNFWHYADIQQGIVSICPETQGLFIPQMLNYEQWGAISFTKGCYVGQEIVARTQHLGKLKRHLHSFVLTSSAKPGEEITHQDKKGVIAAIALNPEGSYSVLAVLQD